MLITILKTAAGPDLTVNAGDVVELPDDQARALIDAGAATRATLPPETLSALADH